MGWMSKVCDVRYGNMFKWKVWRMILVRVLDETIFLQVLVQVFVLRVFSFADSRTQSDYFINWTSLSWIQTVGSEIRLRSCIAKEQLWNYALVQETKEGNICVNHLTSEFSTVYSNNQDLILSFFDLLKQIPWQLTYPLKIGGWLQWHALFRMFPFQGATFLIFLGAATNMAMQKHHV